MARLEAVLDANITPFQKALSEAAAKAREFGEGTADVGKDLFKGLTGFDIGKALGIGGAIYAAKALGEALIDAAKEGYAEFQKFQDAVLSFKYTLPATAGDLAERERIAKEEAEAAEKRVGAFDFETQYRAAQALMQASRVFGESIEKTNEAVKHLTALAIITRSTPEAEAENLRRALVSRKEDSGEMLGKFFKRTAGLEEQARIKREEEAARHPEEAAEIRRMGIPEFMAKETRGKTDEEIIRLLNEMIAKAAPEKVIEEHRETHPEEALIAPLTAMRDAFGEKLLPVVKDFTDALVASIPAVTEFGLDVLDLLIPVLDDVATIFKAVGTAFSFIATNVFAPLRKALEELVSFIRGKILEGFNQLWGWVVKLAESSSLLKEAFSLNAAAIKAAADIITTAVQTIAGWLHLSLPGSVETGPESAGKEPAAESAGKEPAAESAAYKKNMEDAAATQLRADSSHAETQHRINAEAEAFDIRQTARAEARAVLSHRAIGATEELDKEYAARAAGEAKIINIRAEGAIKIAAAQEAEAERIDKIKAAADERSLKRAEEDRNTFGMTQDEIDARSAVRRAEDAASATAIGDAQDEAAEKIREANIDAANQVIDAQEEAADKIIDLQEAAALAQLDKMQGPYAIEAAPEGPETFTKWAKGGGVIEGSADRKAREERNAAAQEANRQWKEMQKLAIEHEFAEKKRVIEDQLEKQRPTLIGLKRTHELQQEEHVKAIEAEKGRTEADQEFAAAHKGLGLPEEPRKEATGKADISRTVLANLLAKILEVGKAQLKDFDAVFMTE